MATRLDYGNVSPASIRALMGLELHVRGSDLGAALLHLIKLRASQINGCAYCVDMHYKDARAAGESEQRLAGVCVWRETPYFSEAERAALAWTEALTLVSEHGVPDELFDAVRMYYSDAQVVDLTMAVIAINGWNRLAIAFRPAVGSYRPPESGEPHARSSAATGEAP